MSEEKKVCFPVVVVYRLGLQVVVGEDVSDDSCRQKLRKCVFGFIGCKC